MAIDRAEFLEVVRDSYSAYYDIVPQEAAEALPLAFRAEYFSRAEKYWLSKSITVWANETNEYAYVFSAPAYDKGLVDACIDFALGDALPRVRPHKEHQYTNVKVVLLGDSFEDGAVKALMKRSFSKSYRFSLHGFTNLLAAAVDVRQGRTWTNKAGHQLAGYFKKLFDLRGEKV